MKKALEIIRLLDSKGKFSLTNASIYAIVTRLLTAGNLTTIDGIAAAVVFLGYAWKRWINFQEAKAPKNTKTVSELTQAINTLQQKVDDHKNQITSLSMKAGIIRPMAEFAQKNIRKF